MNTREQRARQLGEAAAERSRRPFTITKFSRHEDGYFHARVTGSDGRPIYVTRQFGSWFAPGIARRKGVKVPIFKEVLPHVAAALQEKARAIEKAERKEQDDRANDDAEPRDSGEDVA